MPVALMSTYGTVLPPDTTCVLDVMLALYFPHHRPCDLVSLYHTNKAAMSGFVIDPNVLRATARFNHVSSKLTPKAMLEHIAAAQMRKGVPGLAMSPSLPTPWDLLQMRKGDRNKHGLPRRKLQAKAR